MRSKGSHVNKKKVRTKLFDDEEIKKWYTQDGDIVTCQCGFFKQLPKSKKNFQRHIISREHVQNLIKLGKLPQTVIPELQHDKIVKLLETEAKVKCFTLENDVLKCACGFTICITFKTDRSSLINHVNGKNHKNILSQKHDKNVETEQQTENSTANADISSNSIDPEHVDKLLDANSALDSSNAISPNNFNNDNVDSLYSDEINSNIVNDTFNSINTEINHNILNNNADIQCNSTIRKQVDKLLDTNPALDSCDSNSPNHFENDNLNSDGINSNNVNEALNSNNSEINHNNVENNHNAVQETVVLEAETPSKSVSVEYVYVKKNCNPLKNKKTCKERKKVNKDLLKLQENEAHIKYAAMSLLRDLSFRQSALVLNDFDTVITDSKILKKMQAKPDYYRKKQKKIIDHVIAPSQKAKLTKILREQEFSICIDETTDLTNDQSLGIIVRYIDFKRNKICDDLWDIVLCRDSDETQKVDAEHVYRQIIQSFNEAKVPMENVLAFCSDTTNLMMGENNSVASRFQRDFKFIKIKKCDCHIEHLAAMKAIKQFPENIISLLSEVHGYLKDSARRTYNFQVLETKCNQGHLRMTKYTVLRWLSFHNCSKNLLRRWSLLKIFFDFEIDYYEDNTQKVAKDPKDFKDIFNDPIAHASYIFLEHALSKMVLVNKTLQSENPILPQSNQMLVKLYSEFLSFYMKEDYLKETNITDVHPENKENFKELDDLYIGQECEKFLKEKFPNEFKNDEPNLVNYEDKQRLEEFLKTCQNFYREACKTLYDKIDFSTDVRYIFNKDNVFDEEIHQQYPTLDEVFENYMIIKASKDNDLKTIINDEWAKLSTYEFTTDFKNTLNDSTADDEFWFKLLEFADDDGIQIFKNLAHFVLTTCCIPHANAAPERLWSSLTIIKTKTRNKLHHETVRSLLLSFYYVYNLGGMKNFVVTPEMMERMGKPLFAKTKKKVNKNIEDTADFFGNAFLSLDEKLTAFTEDSTYNPRLKRKRNTVVEEGDGFVTIDNVENELSKTVLNPAKKFKPNEMMFEEAMEEENQCLGNDQVQSNMLISSEVTAECFEDTSNYNVDEENCLIGEENQKHLDSVIINSSDNVNVDSEINVRPELIPSSNTQMEQVNNHLEYCIRPSINIVEQVKNFSKEAKKNINYLTMA